MLRCACNSEHVLTQRIHRIRVGRAGIGAAFIDVGIYQLTRKRGYMILTFQIVRTGHDGLMLRAMFAL